MLPPASRLHHQHGFTLVEVMVGIVLLLVGILGVVSLVDNANSVTSKTRAREAGTNIARSVIEVSRSIRYRDLSTASLQQALGARPGLEDTTGGGGHTIRSRDVDYDTIISVCSLDDPKDGLGARPVGVTFCAESAAAGAVVRDRNPDDYKRVRVTLVWETRSTSQSVTQTSSIINPVGGLGPSVTGLTMTSPSSSSSTSVRIDSEVPSATFVATTSGFAADLSWSVKGARQGGASGGPTNWTFHWEFLDENGDIAWYDCNYAIQADAVDAQGRAGTPRAVTVMLNRRDPIAPVHLEGGRNGNGARVDLRWGANPECDVVGYRVYRSTSADSLGAQVTCAGQENPEYTVETECLDDGAPAGVPLYYRVVALDNEASGALRQSDDFSEQLAVGDGSNELPSVPQNVTSCIGGQLDCVTPDGEPAPQDAIVVRWDRSTDSDGSVPFYRIYRDGETYGDRHDVFFDEGGVVAWLEFEAPDGASHAYRVTAVDDDFGESGLSAPVTAP